MPDLVHGVSRNNNSLLAASRNSIETQTDVNLANTTRQLDNDIRSHAATITQNEETK